MFCRRQWMVKIKFITIGSNSTRWSKNAVFKKNDNLGPILYTNTINKTNNFIINHAVYFLCGIFLMLTPTYPHDIGLKRFFGEL